MKMNKAELRRQNVFNKFSKHLNFLIQIGVLKNYKPKYDFTYICPLCLDHFSIYELNQSLPNPLTLEDTPPKSLGGKANILTCKSCNNVCGQKIDWHLFERMKELDMYDLLPNQVFNAKFKFENEIVQGTVKINQKGVITVLHMDKSNNPIKLGSYVNQVKMNALVNIIFPDTRVDPNILQIAILKTGLLLSFEKFGYTFILNSCYDKIREQLIKPNELIYPLDSWFKLPPSRRKLNVPFITEKGLESIFPIFKLSTSSSIRQFGVIIPLPFNSISQTINELKLRFQKSQNINVKLYDMEGDDFLFDKKAIFQMLTWIEKRSK